MDIYSLKKPPHKYFTLLAMLSVTMMIIAMLFTYRIIKIGPFTTPGAVFIFAMTYTLADIITEVYGIKLIKQVIWSTFFCIIFFNLGCFFLIKIPTTVSAYDSQAYDLVFGHNIYLLFGFSISFILSDFVNALAINHWKTLLKGKYFLIRSIGSSAIGETIFGIIAAGLMYSHYMNFFTFVKVVSSTWVFKVATAIIVAYPATLIVELLKKSEGINDSTANFTSLTFEDK